MYAIRSYYVSFDSELPNEAWSDRNGVYKTGIATNGSLKVTYHHPSYHIKTFEINLNSGLTQVMDVSLDPRSVVQISGTIFDSENMSGLGSVQIVVV